MPSQHYRTLVFELTPDPSLWTIAEIALSTFLLASRDTVPDPFTTRDTVAVETPASLAMSITVHDRTFLPIGMRLHSRNSAWRRAAYCAAAGWKKFVQILHPAGSYRRHSD